MSILNAVHAALYCEDGREIRLPIEETGQTNGEVRTLAFEETAGCGGKADGICRIGRVKLELNDVRLGKESPVKLWLTAEELPEQMTAMYMLNDWWTRPAFIRSFAEIPDRTQVVFLKYRSGYGCLVPMVGERFKAYAVAGNSDELCLEMRTTLAGQTCVDEPLYAYARAETLQSAVHAVFECLAECFGIRMREERRLPEIFQYLGWCSWDAFYRDISDAKVRKKASELSGKQVPVKWMLMDDGWMTMNLEQEVVQAYSPDPAKFPNAFKMMIRDIKEQTDIRWFGVWHALCGFWKGIETGSPVYEQEKEFLYHTANGRNMPDPMRGGERFYRAWYDLLSREGIDFVKVDGQSSFWDYADGSLPIGPAAKGIHQALEGGGHYMDGAIINCMGMGMEDILSRPSSAVSRNSDDFVPKKENGFAEHLLQNAYNSIYHNEIYVCDWDMFWTKHPDAVKHSLLRAVSGGPVYVSDKIGETEPAVLKPLAYSDGRILMMDHSARPTEDCLFTDPMKDGVLKLHNTADWGGCTAGGIAAYNLTGRPQTFTVSPSEVAGLEAAETYRVYDYFTGESFLSGREECIERTLDAEGFAWYVMLPETQYGACLGLIDKYVGFSAVEAMMETDHSATVIVREAGRIGWLTEKEPKKVLVNGVEAADCIRREGSLVLIDLAESSAKTIVTLEF